MRPGERAELERQGAKAAARGEPVQSNPLLLKVNMPVSTGESPQEWAARNEAWQAGYRGERRVGPAPVPRRRPPGGP